MSCHRPRRRCLHPGSAAPTGRNSIADANTLSCVSSCLNEKKSLRRGVDLHVESWKNPNGAIEVNVMSRLSFLVVAAISMCCATAGNAAIVTNGDFEKGDLSGWTVSAGTDPSHPPIVIGYNNTNGF